jgi:hypothetical protein
MYYMYQNQSNYCNSTFDLVDYIGQTVQLRFRTRFGYYPYYNWYYYWADYASYRMPGWHIDNFKIENPACGKLVWEPVDDPAAVSLPIHPWEGDFQHQALLGYDYWHYGYNDVYPAGGNGVPDVRDMINPVYQNNFHPDTTLRTNWGTYDDRESTYKTRFRCGPGTGHRSDSILVTPPIDLSAAACPGLPPFEDHPSPPKLTYWESYDLTNYWYGQYLQYGSGTLWVRVDGGSRFERVQGAGHVGNQKSNGWELEEVDLGDYIGKTVQFGFWNMSYYYYANNPWGYWPHSYGWAIDDFDLRTTCLDGETIYWQDNLEGGLIPTWWADVTGDGVPEEAHYDTQSRNVSYGPPPYPPPITPNYRYSYDPWFFGAPEQPGHSGATPPRPAPHSGSNAWYTDYEKMGSYPAPYYCRGLLMTNFPDNGGDGIRLTGCDFRVYGTFVETTPQGEVIDWNLVLYDGNPDNDTLYDTILIDDDLEWNEGEAFETGYSPRTNIETGSEFLTVGDQFKDVSGYFWTIREIHMDVWDEEGYIIFASTAPEYNGFPDVHPDSDDDDYDWVKEQVRSPREYSPYGDGKYLGNTWDVHGDGVWDDDGDGKFDEDPIGDANGDGNLDDDGDWRPGIYYTGISYPTKLVGEDPGWVNEPPADATSATLTFYHWMNIEPFWDCGWVEARSGMGSWQTIEPVGGYFNSDGCYEGVHENGLGYNNPNYEYNPQPWQQAEFDLSSYIGSSAQVRWRFHDDGVPFHGDGWYIDDVEVELVGCPKGFDDDFEYSELDPELWSIDPDPDTVTRWEHGSPSVVGPSSAWSGTRLVGTDLDANYQANTDTTLTREQSVELTCLDGTGKFG